MIENDENQSKIIPSYKKDKEEKSKFEKTKTKKVKSRITKFIIIILAIVVIVSILMLIFKIISSKSSQIDLDYESNMSDYGFVKLYNNGKASGSDTVTRSEAIKIIVATTINKDSVRNLIDMKKLISDYDWSQQYKDEDIEKKLEYKNQIWVEYAKNLGMISSDAITKSNESQSISVAEFLVYLSKAKLKLLNKGLDTTLEKQIKNMETYNADEQTAIKDMLQNGILDENETNLKRSLKKKDLNKFIVKYVIQYNTITLENEKINISKDKTPSNSNEYPYTLVSVKKSTYEIPNYVADASKYKNSKQTYAEMKEYYGYINQLVQNYYNTILNVDYATIDESKFEKNILESTLYKESKEDIDNYLKYVKENKIKISGSAKVQYPDVYFDGNVYRVRVSLNYKIENSNNKSNLLYKDLTSKSEVKYDKTSEEIFIDIPFSKANTSSAIYIISCILKNIISGDVLKLDNNYDVTNQNQSGNNNTYQNYNFGYDNDNE